MPASSDSTKQQNSGDTPLAVSIMFFAVALLCTLLGWAEGVRRDKHILHIPETPGWLLTAVILIAVGLVFFLWSKRNRRAA